MAENAHRRLLYHAVLPHHYVFFRPVYERLAEDERLEWYWSANLLGWRLKKHVLDLFPVKGKKVSSLLSGARSYDMLLAPVYLKFDVAPRARLRVQVFHGVAITNCFLKADINDYDKFFMIGPYMVRRLVEKGFLREDDPRIEMIGMPKLDRLARGEIDTEAVREELELDPEVPVVLYAPSGTYSSITTNGLGAIERLQQMPINLLIKLHDTSLDFRRNKKDWLAQVKQRAGGQVRVVEGFDIVPYLAVADVMISDFSSAANEFLLRDRPLVFLATPEKYEINKERWDTEVWGQKTGVVVNSLDELEAAVEDALAQPERMSEIRRAAAADIFYQPGTATERAVDKIYHLLELETPVAAA
ncbi:MAG: CDP-glycerol glycerophosphotransferase family protein [Acidobacteria bacterium]|nr:CDP-glycerol glycerophosphotransferase family protein [Acidobacteriota bacterium]